MIGLTRVLLFVASLLAALALQLVQLPESLAEWRPLWLPITLVYWSLLAPDLPIMSAAFVCGIACDVLFDGPLGQHALVFLGLALGIHRLRVNLVLLPLWQLSLVLAPVWALTTFALFWLDGLNHHPADPWLRWMPVAGSTLIWPLAVMLMDHLQSRRRRRPQDLRAA